MSSVYRPLLRRAWLLTLHAKQLWLFGLFSALVVSGGEINVLLRNFDRVSTLGTLTASVREGGFDFSFLTFTPWWGLPTGFYVVSALLLLLVCFLVWFALVSQGALIWALERERRREHRGVEESIAAGKRNFWRTTILTVGFHVITSVAWVIFSLPPFLLYLAFGSSLWYTLFLLVSFLCLIPLGLLCTFLYRLALVAALTESLSPVDALRSAWRLFLANWLVVIEMVIILTFGTTVAAVIALSVAVVGLIIIFGPLALLSFIMGVPLAVSLTFGAVVVAFFLSIMGVGALLATFQQAVWLLLYTRLKESPPFAKIVRIIASLPRLFQRRAAE
ncbi:MAG: hypothetical protein AB1352_00625 [Patescibacteria group bacterium]